VPLRPPIATLFAAAAEGAALLALAGVVASPAAAARPPAASAVRSSPPPGAVAVAAVPTPPGSRDPQLWATINVCDTTGYPDGVGIRGSMPGTGDRRDALFMRFQVQFYRPSAGAWVSLGRAGDSGFLELGNGDARARQAGRTFTVMPPAAGRPAYLMRGLVTFEWRRDSAVVRRARRLTSDGRPGTPGADPADFSSATCSVR
jgi:hypothetical protein